MDSYFELKALPNPEIVQSQVVSHLIQILHSILPLYGGRIGLGFPAYGQQRTMGGLIRAFGDQVELKCLRDKVSEQPDIRDYVLVTQVAKLPETNKGFVCYERFHARGGSKFRRQMRRHAARGTWSTEVAEASALRYSEKLSSPYLALKSASTGQNFLLFVRERSSQASVVGSFNAYGLATAGATVPKF